MVATILVVERTEVEQHGAVTETVEEIIAISN